MKKSQHSIIESEQIVVEILGQEKFINYFDSVSAWWGDLPTVQPRVPFSSDTLRQCAEENKNGADWRVVWINGFSLYSQAQCEKVNRCFDLGRNWGYFSSEKHVFWGEKSIPSGYRLLNFNKNLLDLTWQEQEDQIELLGEEFERADERIVSEACLTNFFVKKERLLFSWYHAGYSHSGVRLNIGLFNRDGLSAGIQFDQDSRSQRLGVVISRKPE